MEIENISIYILSLISKIIKEIFEEFIVNKFFKKDKEYEVS